MDDIRKREPGADSAPVEFKTMREKFDSKIDKYRGMLTDENARSSIINLANDFASEVTFATDVPHSSMVRFGSDKKHMQITIKSIHGDMFYFLSSPFERIEDD